MSSPRASDPAAGPSGAPLEEGLVLRKSSRDLIVETPCAVRNCTLRGKLRGAGESASPVVVGDRVQVLPTGQGQGVLERVLPRRSELVRGNGRGQPLVVAANLDAVLILQAARDPVPRWGLVDRMLVTAERSDLAAAIGINKRDQLVPDSAEAAELEEVAALYRQLGYPVLLFSAIDGTDLEGLKEWIGDKTVVVSGHSGVGKSTLLNALSPGLAVPMGEVNPVTGKGRHTTTATTLYKLATGGRVVDTPGFREFFPVDLGPPELGRHYPELRAVLGGCRFGDCLHRGEPACAVRAAVESGAISPRRYSQYLQILSTLLELR